MEITSLPSVVKTSSVGKMERDRWELAPSWLHPSFFFLKKKKSREGKMQGWIRDTLVDQV